MSNTPITNQGPTVGFNVIFLENDGKELAKLIPDLVTHQNKIQQLQPQCYETDKELFKIYNTSLIEAMKISNAVKEKIVDYHYKLGMADKYKIVVSYDSKNKLPQAIGILVLDRKNINEKYAKSIEIYALITAFKNLKYSQNAANTNRLPGAGSSLIKFFKEIGKENKVDCLYVEVPTCAIEFYKKHDFKPLYPQETTDSRWGEDPFGLARIPMIFDLTEKAAI